MAHSPTIAITHLTKISTPITEVRTTSIMNIPGSVTSRIAARISAIGNVMMNGRVAIVREISSLDTIELTRVSIQIAYIETSIETSTIIPDHNFYYLDILQPPFELNSCVKEKLQRVVKTQKNRIIPHLIFDI